MIDPQRKVQIYNELSEMFKKMQYASAIQYISNLSSEEEEYAHEVIGQIENPHGMRFRSHMSIEKVAEYENKPKSKKSEFETMIEKMNGLPMISIGPPRGQSMFQNIIDGAIQHEVAEAERRILDQLIYGNSIIESSNPKHPDYISLHVPRVEFKKTTDYVIDETASRAIRKIIEDLEKRKK